MGQESSRQGGFEACCEQRHFPAHQGYLSQFKGSTPAFDTQHMMNLELHRQPSRGWPRLTDFSEEELIHPSLQRPIKTDWISLIDAGAGPDCHEFCRALCALPPAPGVTEGPGFLHVNPGHADGEVLPADPPCHMQVPAEFSGLHYDWAAPSGSQKKLTDEQQALLQRCMKLFLRAMISGLLLQLRLDPEEAKSCGGITTMNCVASLTHDLETMVITVGSRRREVQLSEIRWVRPPPFDAPPHSWFLPNERDQLVVLRLSGGRLLRLRLLSKMQAAFFGTCTRLLVKSRTQNSNRPARTDRSDLTI